MEAVRNQGQVIRDLKANNAPDSEIQAAILKLDKLKSDLLGIPQAKHQGNEKILAQLRRGSRILIEPCVKKLHADLTQSALNIAEQSCFTTNDECNGCQIHIQDGDKRLLSLLKRFPEETCAELKRMFYGFRLSLDYFSNGPPKSWLLDWNHSENSKTSIVLVDFPLE